jgi:hypothetical protein
VQLIGPCLAPFGVNKQTIVEILLLELLGPSTNTYMVKVEEVQHFFGNQVALVLECFASYIVLLAATAKVAALVYICFMDMPFS